MKKGDKFYSSKLDKEIVISKPWSKEMYAHNDEVATEVRDEVWERWEKAYKASERSRLHYVSEIAIVFRESEWEYNANQEMQDIQDAVTVIGYGSGYNVKDVEEDVVEELENAAYWRLKEIAEDLDLELESEFIGF